MYRNNVSNPYNYRPVSGHVDEQKGEPCTERDSFFPPISYCASVISHLLNQPEASSELDPAFLLPASQKNELLFQSGGNSTFLKEAPNLGQLPLYEMSDYSHFDNEHLRAKRARVENIIRGMTIMPNSVVPNSFGGSDEYHTKNEKNYRENKRKQKLPHQSPHETPLVRPGKRSIHTDECLQLKKQLHVLQHQMKQLGDKFVQPCELGDSSRCQGSLEKTMYLLKEKLGQCLDDDSQVIVSDQHQSHLWKVIPKAEGDKMSEKEAGMMGSSIRSSEDSTLSEILKHELIQVVTQAVDSVLKKVLPNSPGLPSQLCKDPSVTVSSTGRECSGAEEKISRKWLPKFYSHKPSASRTTEKPPGFPTYPTSSKMERKTQVNCPLIMTSDIQRNGLLGQMLLCSQNGHWGSTPLRTASSLESLDVPWQPVKLKSSVMRHQRYPMSLKSTEIESLASLSASNVEFSEICAAVDEIPFHSAHVQEALTPSHLRKAKLMFFFTRYPSSSLLKAYFLDVQFTRCITSQLIKWFSNFREFYYIQIEKFARQALLEGIPDTDSLIISRESEVFRTLNTHYNKGNDFEVPDGFLDVASLTLREFFRAIKGGKDLDPSWKKPIYKIISKLDSKIPDTFKSSSCLQETIQG